MKMRYLGKKIKNFARRHQGAILTFVSSAGVVGTIITTNKAAVKYTKDSENVDGVEKVKLVAKSYYPVLVSGCLTIGSIAFTNVLNGKQQKAILGTCAVASKQFKEYRNTVKNELGEEREKEIYEHCIHKAEFHRIDANTSDEKIWFYEPISKQHFKCSERELIDAEYHLNRNYALSCESSVNEMLLMFGLEPIPNGDYSGWHAEDGIMWIDFEHVKSEDYEGEPCYTIFTIFPPEDEIFDNEKTLYKDYEDSLFG